MGGMGHVGSIGHMRSMGAHYGSHGRQVLLGTTSITITAITVSSSWACLIIMTTTIRRLNDYLRILWSRRYRRWVCSDY